MFRSTFISVAKIIGLVFIGIIIFKGVGSETDDQASATTGESAKRSASSRTASNPKSPGIVALSADRGGHFEVSALINGKHVNLMADTGASLVALSYAEAKRLGLNPEKLPFNGISMTANGQAKIKITKLDTVKVGGILLRDVKVAIAEPGKLSTNLLGMSFIGRLSKFELKGRQLVLYR